MTGKDPGASRAYVTVKALGFLVQRLPAGKPVEIDFPATGGLTAGDAMRLAGLPDEEVFLVVVNGRRATLDRPLEPGDEVTFVPPVAGG